MYKTKKINKSLKKNKKKSIKNKRKVGRKISNKKIKKKSLKGGMWTLRRKTVEEKIKDIIGFEPVERPYARKYEGDLYYTPYILGPGEIINNEDIISSEIYLVIYKDYIYVIDLKKEYLKKHLNISNPISFSLTYDVSEIDDPDIYVLVTELTPRYDSSEKDLEISEITYFFPTQSQNSTNSTSSPNSLTSSIEDEYSLPQGWEKKIDETQEPYYKSKYYQIKNKPIDSPKNLQQIFILENKFKTPDNFKIEFKNNINEGDIKQFIIRYGKNKMYKNNIYYTTFK
jgi:hypothetical protein